MQQQEELTGIVDHIIFHNTENGFTVFVLQVSRTEKTTIKGHAAALHAGQQVTVQGSWIFHPKFGKQFEAIQCTVTLPTSTLGIKKYLSSGMIKGIGPVYAEKLVKKFGAETLEIIDKYPYRLREINGIGIKRIDRIIAAWRDQKEISHIMVFLQSKNISPTYAVKIFKKYGAHAITVIQENPYKLADDIWGIGFKTADSIALGMGLTHDSLKRIRSGLLYSLTTHINSTGNLYVELDALKVHACSLLEIESNSENDQKIKGALHELYEQKIITLISYESFHYITLASHYYSEKGIAHSIQQLMTTKSRFHFSIDTIYQQLRTSTAAIALNEDQQRGILSCLQHKVTIITGGPGTGKTTLIKQLLAILDNHKINYRLAAPTGRAAKRITESTNRAAVTLHRLLEFDVNSMRFKHNEHNALNLDFLIIDEASMIDLFLAYATVKALPYHAHVVFIGDVHQLPSVGPGNVLYDLIASTILPTIRLTTIFRQAQNSMIILNAHRINNGEFPSVSFPHALRDFLFIKEEDPLKIPHHLETIYTHTLNNHAIDPSNATVLTPMNRGNAGTIMLNQMLQNLLNPSAQQPTLSHRGITFRVGDRVMQIKNNYDKLIFNGDIGSIDTIDTIDQCVTVRFLDHYVSYEITDLDELVLAYAISIHKSQGSEFDAVIIPIFMQHFTLLQRNLVYTAITRAKKLCIFIGQPKALAIAIKNVKGYERRTFLTQFLTSNLACR